MDISSTAERAASVIHMLWDYAMASRSEELLRVSLGYIEMKRDFDIQGNPLVVHITSESTGQRVWVDGVDFNALADALGDLDEIGKRAAKVEAACSVTGESACKPLGIDMDSVDALLKRFERAAGEAVQ